MTMFLGKVNMTENIRNDINLDLADPEYARLYGEALAKAELAITLSLARQQAGLTQAQLAEKCGKSQPYIAKLESEEANPTIGAIGDILAVLGLRLIIKIAPLSPAGLDSIEDTARTGRTVEKQKEPLLVRETPKKY